MNDENLRPVTTKNEARERGRNGGIKSGIARRRKKSMREWAEVLGEVSMTLELLDGSEIDADVNAAVVLKQIEKAVKKKDTNAAAFLMRLRGEDVQKHEIVDDEVKRKMLAEQMANLYGVPNDEEETSETDED